MAPAKRYDRKQAKAIQRRRLNAKERHECQQRQAQRDIEALHQALHDLGLPDDLIAEIEGRLRSQNVSDHRGCIPVVHNISMVCKFTYFCAKNRLRRKINGL